MVRRILETVRSVIVMPQHLQLTMNSRSSPQGIGDGHLLDQSADFARNGRSSSARTYRSRESGPESAKPFSLPTPPRIRLNENQWVTPITPNLRQTYPEQPIQLRQHRPFALPLVSG